MEKSVNIAMAMAMIALNPSGIAIARELKIVRAPMKVDICRLTDYSTRSAFYGKEVDVVGVIGTIDAEGDVGMRGINCPNNEVLIIDDRIRHEPGGPTEKDAVGKYLNAEYVGEFHHNNYGIVLHIRRVVRIWISE